jgi:hypothetical protein
MRVSSPVSRPSANCRANLHGALDQVGLPALLTMLDLERRSGVLLIRRSGEVGRLWISHGRVLRAQIEGSDTWTGRAAACRILAWEQGRFELTRDQVTGDDEIDMPTTHLLMEAAQLRDEAEAEAETRLMTESELEAVLSF